MGLLPQIADGVNISIPTAGHLISAYAIGVVVGAPVIAALGARTGEAAAARTDGGVRARQRVVGRCLQLRVPDGRAVPDRRTARRSSGSARWSALAGAGQPAGLGGLDEHGRPAGLQHHRRPADHADGPETRLAGAVSRGRRTRAADAGGGLVLGDAAAGRQRCQRPQRVERAGPAAGVDGAAGRHGRVRRHVRDVLLHHPDDDRTGRFLRGRGHHRAGRVRRRHDVVARSSAAASPTGP